MCPEFLCQRFFGRSSLPLLSKDHAPIPRARPTKATLLATQDSILEFLDIPGVMISLVNVPNLSRTFVSNAEYDALAHGMNHTGRFVLH